MCSVIEDQQGVGGAVNRERRSWKVAFLGGRVGQAVESQERDLRSWLEAQPELFSAPAVDPTDILVREFAGAIVYNAAATENARSLW